MTAAYLKKYLIVIIIHLVCLTLAMVAAYSQEDMEFVDNSIFDHPRRPAAAFMHDEHNEKAGIDDCAECHHVYDDDGVKEEDESSEDSACADCHGMQDDGRMPGLMKAYHLNCKGCHLSVKKGPVTCGQCHAKK